MSIPNSQHRIGILTALAVLTGCSGGGAMPALSASMQQSVNRYAVAPLAERQVRGGLVYISDSSGSFIDVFDRDGTAAGRITAGLNHPAELFVDADHNLWVANNGDGDVLKFKRGSTTATGVYHDVSDAWDPATCSNGTMYATNLSGSIAVFARRHHRPTGSLSSNFGADISVSCDPAGNIFATSTVFSPPGYVIEFPAGSTQAKLLPIYLFNPVDAKPDPAGNLLVLDEAGGNYNTVTEYTEAGSPTGKSMPTYANWSEMAISPSGKAVFGADVNDLEGSLRAFPSGKELHTYKDSAFSQLGGIAYDPS